MDRVASSLEARIDYLLDYLLARWDELPDIANEWDSWDAVAREVFDLEWSLKEERLEELDRLASSLQLTASQTARYSHLKELVARNRPMLSTLLAS